jgi:hypothetical protein
LIDIRIPGQRLGGKKKMNRKAVRKKEILPERGDADDLSS